MARMLIFGMGYSAQVLAARLREAGWEVRGTGTAGELRFADTAAVERELQRADHILSSVPPERHGGEDPVLRRYGRPLRSCPAQWIGYLSSTGVYGDTGGAWVDESAALGGGRRDARMAADAAWRALDPLRVRVFRLPGIYGPGRSVFDRLAIGRGQRIDLPGQVFSRIHVADLASGVEASFAAPPGIYNLADDLPASQNAVIEEACRLGNLPLPPLTGLAEAELSPAARAFYAESRRVANGKARRVLGWRPAYQTFREGLRALRATTSPTAASPAPAAASGDQR